MSAYFKISSSLTILGVIKKEKGTVPTWKCSVSNLEMYTIKTKQALKSLLHKVASEALDDLEVN